MDEHERIYWLAWMQVRGIGLKSLCALLSHYGSMVAAWKVNAAELLEIEGFGKKTVATIAQGRCEIKPETFYQRYCAANPHFWTLLDEDYPVLLRECPDAPPILHYLGNPHPDDLTGATPSVAIVGTRSPSGYGTRWTRRLTQALVRSGLTIVSGMAKGIDTIAHETCLQNGGRTIAVLGTGVDVIYPRSNQTLYRDISDRGLILSEYPATTAAKAQHFPARNRIVAAMTRATIVTEAPERSGALITARLANDYGREAIALPGSLDDPNLRGCNGLIAKGAAQLVLDEHHLLELLAALPGLDPQPAQPSQSAPPAQLDQSPTSPQPASPRAVPADLADRLRHVLECVPYEPATLDHIAARAALSSGPLLAALLELQLMDLITQLPGGAMYQRC